MKIWRAEFQQPCGELNKLEIRIPDPITVEVRQHKGRARITAPPADADLIPRQPTVEDAKREISRLFERQTTPWVEYIEKYPQGLIPKEEAAA